MKTWDELTDEQQDEAVDKEATYLLTMVCQGALRFDDELNNDDLQASIEGAAAEMEHMRTPWFLSETLWHETTYHPVKGQPETKRVKDQLLGMARCTCEDALYSEPDEYVINGITTFPEGR